MNNKLEKMCYIQRLVSIAIPAYKAEFLSEAIDSALGQDYTNIELIIVNDASPYDLDGILARYNDSRIRYYKNEKNLGKQSIVLNWNKCLSLAKGEFFVLLCDDDILLPSFVSDLLKLSERYPSCNVFHARKYNMYSDGRKEASPVWPDFEEGETFIKNSMNKYRHHTVTEFMFRTLTLKNNRGYVNFPVGFYSDRATIMQIGLTGGIVSSDKCLVIFRFSDGHITSSKDPFYSMEKVKAALDYWRWIHHLKYWIKDFDKQIKEDVQCTIYNSFIVSSFFCKIKILMIVPLDVLSIKERLGFMMTIFS